MDKRAALMLVAMLAASSLIMVESVSAQSNSKPSVPEFTVRVIDHSYDVPTTTTTITDPYDGQITTETTPGYHMVNGSIELSMKNQPFTPYHNSDGFPIRLYYHIRVKGDSPNWSYNPSSESYFQATNSTYTTFVIGYSGNCFQTSRGFNTFRPDGALDFQVEAFIGYMDITVIPSGIVIRQENIRTEYIGQKSGWSDTQTVTIPNASYTPVPPYPLPTTSNPTSPYNPTTTPTATPTSTPAHEPQQTNLTEIIIGAAIAVAMIGAGFGLLIVNIVKRKQTKNACQFSLSDKSFPRAKKYPA